MPDLDDELTGLRTDLTESIRQPKLSAVFDRVLKRKTRQRVQLGVVIIVIAVLTTIPVLRSQLSSAPSVQPGTSTTTTPPTTEVPDELRENPKIINVGFYDSEHGYALHRTCVTETDCVAQLLVRKEADRWDSYGETVKLTSPNVVLEVFSRDRLAIIQYGEKSPRRWYSTQHGAYWTEVPARPTTNADTIPEDATLSLESFPCNGPGQCPSARLVFISPESGQPVALGNPPPLRRPEPAATRSIGGAWWVRGEHQNTNLPVLMVSRDAGRSWTVSLAPQHMDNGLNLEVSTSPDGSVWYTMANERGADTNAKLAFYRSTDQGRTWTQTLFGGAEPPVQPGTKPIVLADGRLVLHNDEAQLVSSDGGRSFAPFGNRPVQGYVREVFPGTYLLAGYGDPMASRSEPTEYYLSRNGLDWLKLGLKP